MEQPSCPGLLLFYLMTGVFRPREALVQESAPGSELRAEFIRRWFEKRHRFGATA
ncbi:MAG TPA: hypothetical protein VIO80_06025 [Candidatus Dormibacteraeota bacterium]